MGGERTVAAYELTSAHVAAFGQTDEGGALGAHLVELTRIAFAIHFRTIDEEHHVGGLGYLTAATQPREGGFGGGFVATEL